MPGGKPGVATHVPKRSEQRRRRNKPDIPIDRGVAQGVTSWPDPDPSWHTIARDWYVALQASGQSAYYEQSDVAQARLIAMMMSKLCKQTRPSAALFTNVQAGMASLLTSEADRRRLRIELAKVDVDADEVAAVADLAAYQRDLA